MGGVILYKSNKVKKVANKKEVIITVMRQPSMKLSFISSDEKAKKSSLRCKPSLQRQRKFSGEDSERRPREVSFVNIQLRKASQTLSHCDGLNILNSISSANQEEKAQLSSLQDSRFKILVPQNISINEPKTEAADPVLVPRMNKSRKVSLQTKSSMIPNNLRKRFSMVSPPQLDRSFSSLDKSASDTPSKRKAWCLVSSLINRKVSTVEEKKDKRTLHKNLHSLTELEQPLIVEQLLRFIINDECDKLKYTLNKLDTTDIPGIKTLVHQAAYKGCSRCCYTLLKQGFPIDRTDIEGWTPLHAAVLANNINTVGYLIPLYSSVNIVDSRGLSPLHVAIYKKNLALVRLLVKASADVQLDSGSKTPFQLAIDLKHTEILDYFILLSHSSKKSTVIL